MRKAGLLLIGGAVGLIVIGIAVGFSRFGHWRRTFTPVVVRTVGVRSELLSPFQKAVVNELERQVHANIRYQDGYYRGGEPPAQIGVCTDVVLRAFRAGGVDLQQAVTKDIRTHRSDYPIDEPDPNIDHRRCRNLVVYFKKYGVSLPTSGPNADWQPGDIVFWDTSGNGKPDHVGVIGDQHDEQGVPSVVHHWPSRPVSETYDLYRIAIRFHFRRRESKLQLQHPHRR